MAARSSSKSATLAWACPPAAPRVSSILSTQRRRVGWVSALRFAVASSCCMAGPSTRDPTLASVHFSSSVFLERIATSEMLGDAIVHVVDDDEFMRSSLEDLLRSVGYQVRLYGRADDFLAAGVPDAPGCVIVDVRMPGPNGFELQAALTDRNDR